jgi:AcrR family transcriptional regulator
VTVFNYFPTKDDLFFGGMEFFEEELIEAVRGRAAGVSVLAAFREPIVDGLARLEMDETARVIAKVAELINASPSLQVRERELVAHYTEVLTRLIADERNVHADDVEAVGVATALMGSHRALVAYVRARILAGVRGPALVEQARSQAIRAFARLDRGLANYAPGRD